MPKNSICPTCGGMKDSRARECQSCGMSRKAQAQWANKDVRAKMVQSLQRVHGQRRTRYEDISEDTIWQFRYDGRAWTWYWDGDTKRTIYRYQWRWEQANGPIPAGYVIHHVNEDKSDDRLENLMCLSLSDHTTLHMDKEQKQRLLDGRGLKLLGPMFSTCVQCGKAFKIKTRSKANKFCSLECYHRSMTEHHTLTTCARCGKTFKAGTDHGRARKYCSRECFDDRGR